MLLTGDRPRRCGGSGSRAIIKFGLRLAAKCNFFLINDPAEAFRTSPFWPKAYAMTFTG